MEADQKVGTELSLHTYERVVEVRTTQVDAQASRLLAEGWRLLAVCGDTFPTYSLGQMARSTEDSLREIARVLLLDTERHRETLGFPRFEVIAQSRLFGADRAVFRALVAETEGKGE